MKHLFVQINPLQSPFSRPAIPYLDNRFVAEKLFIQNKQMNRLENKVAVVYGDGFVGAAIAKAFARQHAKVCLTGRTEQKLSAIADEIFCDGRTIETVKLDALNEEAVEKHISQVIKKNGKVDISFNAIGISKQDVCSVPLIELPTEKFMLPVTTYVQSHFITATAAARRMIQQGHGVILNHTPNASRMSPAFSGGLVPAWAAIEALFRSLSVECAPGGVRAVTLLTSAIPESPLIGALITIRAKSYGITSEQFCAAMAAQTHRKRLTTIDELTNAAVFLASDEGSAITGTILNLTAGIIVQ
jgi:NAD(P)-dependent dehydrogenase (short-subunit alcohol dehydrogenase family)